MPNQGGTPSLPNSTPLSFSPLPFPSLALEVGPLNPGGPVSAISSRGGVWGGAPAEIDFGSF